MNRVEEFIQKLCPDGVPFRRLGDIATISRGGSFQKKDFTELGVPCIHYGQIYTRYGLFVNETITYISEETAQEQKFAEPNDVVMAVTSENIEDVCKCVAWLGDGKVAVSGHTAIIHHSMNPKYLVYWLHSSSFYQQKAKIANGTKVIEVAPAKLCDVILPVPPLEVQREIVRILDTFTELTGDLTEILSKEFIARKQQYAYYRDMLLTHSSKTKICKLVDICESIADGDHMPPPKASDGVPFITISNITEQNKIDFSNTMFVPRSYYDALADKRKPHSGDILYTVVGSYGIPVCIEQDSEFVFQRHIAILRPRPENIKARYMFHAMQSSAFKAQADKAAKGAAQKTIGLSSMVEMTLPVPDMHVQERLIHVLDNFDTICSDLNIGLSDEIEARKKQYEFYRDQLLTFAAQDDTILTDRQTDEYNALIRLCQYVFGYAFVKLSLVADVFRGEYITKKDSASGDVPVILGGQEPAYYIDKANHTGEAVVVARSGASAGFVSYWNEPIFVTDCFGFEARQNLITPKFLYYILKNMEQTLNDMKRGAGVPHLSGEALLNIPLCIPPIKEQGRIVETLDRFDALCTDLSAGLPAEIEARKKQYEYYRDKLLSFTPAD